jgi:hypothetical protein
LAFTSVILGQKDLGGAKLLYGTWDATGVTTGTITFGGTRGGAQGPPHTILDGGAISSVSAVTMTASKITATGTMVITCVSGDAGYWSVTLI